MDIGTKKPILSLKLSPQKNTYVVNNEKEATSYIPTDTVFTPSMLNILINFLKKMLFLYRKMGKENEFNPFH